MAYLMPSGTILAARDALAAVKTSTDAEAHDVMAIPVQALGGATLMSTLDASGRPIHTRIDVGGKSYSADFSDYLSDRMDMEVQFPHKIAIQVDGKPIADWQLEYHHANPYLVFPVPQEARG